MTDNERHYIDFPVTRRAEGEGITEPEVRTLALRAQSLATERVSFDGKSKAAVRRFRRPLEGYPAKAPQFPQQRAHRGLKTLPHILIARTTDLKGG
jgi:hypothetical protein